MLASQSSSPKLFSHTCSLFTFFSSPEVTLLLGLALLKGECNKQTGNRATSNGWNFLIPQRRPPEMVCTYGVLKEFRIARTPCLIFKILFTGVTPRCRLTSPISCSAVHVEAWPVARSSHHLQSEPVLLEALQLLPPQIPLPCSCHPLQRVLRKTDPRVGFTDVAKY